MNELLHNSQINLSARGRVRLRSAPAAAGEIAVDRAAGIIRNARVISVGEAQGHGFQVDPTTLTMFLSIVQNDGPTGTLMHFKHPPAILDADGNAVGVDDALETLIGRLVNCRIEGAGDQACIRGDIQLGDHAASLPGLGDVRTFLLNLAESDPAAFGLSAEMDNDYEPLLNSSGQPIALAARPRAILAVDVVDKPAANPNGLLSAKPANPVPVTPAQTIRPAPGQSSFSGASMHPHLKGLLTGAGADPKSSDQQFSDFHAKMPTDAKAKVDQAHAAFCAANPDEANANMNTVDAGPDGAADANLSAGELPAAAGPTARTITIKGLHKGTDGQFHGTIVGTAPAAAAAGTPRADIVTLEAKRVGDIRQLGKTLGTSDAAIRNCIAKNLSPAESRGIMLTELESTAAAIDTVRVGPDNQVDMLRNAMPDAILLRANPGMFKANKYSEGEVAHPNAMTTEERAPHAEAKRFASLDLIGMYRHYLVQLGVPAVEVMDMSRTELAGLMGPRACRRRFAKYARVVQLTETTSDFPAITVDAINKSLRYSYLDGPRTWPQFCQRKTANDFKTINRVVLSEQPSLIQTNDGGELKYVTLKDSNQTYVLQEYKAGIRLNRRAIINDDKDAFSALPRSQASACTRLEEDVVYQALNGYNPVTGIVGTLPTLADGGNVFNVTAVTTAGGHANLIASGSGGAPTVLSQLESTENLMLVQSGLQQAAILDLTPKFMIVPTNLFRQTRQAIESDLLIGAFVSSSGAATGIGNANPFKDALTVIKSVRMSRVSTIAWIMMADFRDAQVDTIEISFLTDEPEPVVRQQTDFDTDDVLFNVRHTVAAQVIDFRGMAQNYGS